MLLERENEEFVVLLPSEKESMVARLISQESSELYVNRKNDTISGLDADGYVFWSSTDEFSALLDKVGDN